MKLLLNFEGTNKIYPGTGKIVGFSELKEFAEKNFNLNKIQWQMLYMDEDGDWISLSTDTDLKNMMETIERKHIKIYIKLSSNCQKQFSGKEGKTAEQIINEMEKKQDQEINCQKTEENTAELQNKWSEWGKKCHMYQQGRGWQKWKGWQKCQKGQWKKKIEEKMTKFIDDRIETLIPVLTDKISAKIQGKQKNNEIKSNILHDCSCSGCGILPIMGIRYKCLECYCFNFCENCQKSIEHQHNMMKMKYPEEKIEEPKVKGHPFLQPDTHRRPPSFQKKRQRDFLPPPPMRTHMQWAPPAFVRGHRNCGPPHPFMKGSNQFIRPPPMGPPHLFCPPVSPINNHGLNQRQIAVEVEKKIESPVNDDEKGLKVTNKCFRLAKYYNDLPSSFREFVMENCDLGFNQLTKKYHEINPDAKPCDDVVKKNEQKLTKLAFHFNEPIQNFEQLVVSHPGKNFKELAKMIKQQRQDQLLENLSKKYEEILIDDQFKPLIEVDNKCEPKEQQQKDANILEEKNCQGKINTNKKMSQFIELLKSLIGEEETQSEYAKFYLKYEQEQLDNQSLIAFYLDEKAKE